MRARFFENTQRVVIKIGSSVLESRREAIPSVIDDLIQDLALLKMRIKRIQPILVSSGAIAAGMRILRIGRRPAEMEKLQALAAIGQPDLMERYQSACEKHSLKSAQMLLTWEDLGNRKRFENTRRTLEAILRYDAVPVINENDTVATEEIQFGDNDKLSAMVAILFEADLLIILTDSNGLYADFKAGHSSRISFVDSMNASVFESVRDSENALSKGGMKSKLMAIEKALKSGIACALADGREQGILSRLFYGEDSGTFFMPQIRKGARKRHWIAYISKAEGVLEIDDGAQEAILRKGKSLLSKGILKVTGHFDAGSAVTLKSPEGRVLGKGIVNFSSSELDRIKGLDSRQWEKHLDRPCMDEVLHRDNFVAASEF